MRGRRGNSFDKVSPAFSVPVNGKEAEYEVKVGLWSPEKIGEPDERWIPEGGEPDRRVFLGTLRVGVDGGVSFVPH